VLVDSHVNLHGERFAGDLPGVLARAEAAGVGAMLAISDRLEDTGEIAAIVRGRPNLWRTVGVHPHHAKDFEGLRAETLIALAEPADVIGIGECGLDHHYEYSDRKLQEPVFRAHVAAARAMGLPLVIHAREADEEVRRVLKEEREEGAFTPLLHCYTGGMALAEDALAMGGYVSFSGIITFKNADAVRAVAEMVPMDRVLIETDCPFLAPVPHRGRRCEPAHLVHVAEKLAEVKGISMEEVARATTDNFFRLFSHAERPS
jgi:TatD DNase family protein